MQRTSLSLSLSLFLATRRYYTYSIFCRGFPGPHLHISASQRRSPSTCAGTRRTTDRGTGQLAVLPPQQQSTPGCWPPIIAFSVYGGGNIAAKRNKIGRAARGCKKSAVTDFSSRLIGLSSRVVFRARRRITAIDLSPFAPVLKCLMSATSPSSSSSFPRFSTGKYLSLT